jgi:hypothetical protein
MGISLIWIKERARGRRYFQSGLTECFQGLLVGAVRRNSISALLGRQIVSAS